MKLDGSYQRHPTNTKFAAEHIDNGCGVWSSKRQKCKPTFACAGAASFLLLFLRQRIEELLQAEIRPDPADVMNHFTQRTFYPGALLELLHTAGTERVITRQNLGVDINLQTHRAL